MTSVLDARLREKKIIQNIKKLREKKKKKDRKKKDVAIPPTYSTKRLLSLSKGRNRPNFSYWVHMKIDFFFWLII